MTARRPVDRGRKRRVHTADEADEQGRRLHRADNSRRSILGDGVYRLGHLPTADEQAATSRACVTANL